MKGNRFVQRLCCALVAALLAACGNSGTGGPAIATAAARATPEGLWVGTLAIANGAARAFAGPVLDTGEYWFLYSAPNAPATVAGLMHGTSAFSGNALTSTDGQDYNFDGTAGLSNFGITGTFAGERRFGGSVAYSSGTSGAFDTTYDRDYDLKPSLSVLNGRYVAAGGSMALASNGASGQGLSNVGRFLVNADISIAATGEISGTMQISPPPGVIFFPVGNTSCPVVGTATPRTSGNIYDIQISAISPAGPFCIFSYTGIGFLDTSNADLRLGLLGSAAQLPFGSYGTVIVANRVP